MFELKDEDGNAYGTGGGTFTSDSDGLVTIVYFGTGRYTLTEMSVPTGYAGVIGDIVIHYNPTSEDEVLTVDLPEGYSSEDVPVTQATSSEMATITIRNKISVPQMKKVDTLGYPISGAVFAIYKQVKTSDGYEPDRSPYSGYENLSTGSDGILQMTEGHGWADLPRGTYYLREVSAPSDYIKLTKDICFTLKADGTLVLEDEVPAGVTMTTTDADGVVTYTIQVVDPFKTGSLQISKTVATSGLTFTLPSFTVTVTASKNNRAITGDYATTVTTAENPTGTQQTVTFNDGEVTFTIKDGETWTIAGLPIGTSYTVAETTTAGWTQTTPAADLTGAIPDGGTATAALVNVYDASATLTLGGTKKMTGRAMTAGEFTFQLLDSNGSILQTATNAAGEDGAVTDFTFANAFPYGLSDVGKTYTYTVKEVAGTANGVIYDTTVYTVTVTPTDNGNGTLTATPSIKKGEEPVSSIAFTNSYEVISLTVVKAWEDKDDAFGIRPTGVTVQLYQTIGSDEKEKCGDSVTLNATTDPQWSYTWNDLPKYAKDSAGDVKAVTYSVEENAPMGYIGAVTGSMSAGYTITNTPETVKIDVEKKWTAEATFQPTSVTVELLKNGASFSPKKTATLSENNEWKASWTGLPKYYKNTINEIEPVEYTVVEDPVPESYRVEYDPVSVAGQNGTIVVKNTPETVDIKVVKEWPTPQADIQPTSVTVELLADGVSYDPKKTATLDADNSWTQEWTGLPKYKGTGSNREEITYTVVETVPTGYTESYDPSAGYTGQNGTITITNTPETIDIPVVKEWASPAAFEPESVTVKLYRKIGSGEKELLDTRILRADNTPVAWSYTWKDMPKYGKDGATVTEITYSVEEDTVPIGYTVAITGDASGFTITNTPHETDVSVLKVWDDAEDQDGKRPETIQVQLYQTIGSGTEAKYGDAVTLDDTTTPAWSYTWEHLPAKQGDDEITYRVDEVAVPAEYEKTVTNKATAYTITNSYEPKTTKLHVAKTWDDAKDQDGKRDDYTFTVQLYKKVGDNVEKVGEPVEVPVTDGEFKAWDLPVYEDGKFITYYVVETMPDGSEYTKSGDDESNGIKASEKDDLGTIEITNSYEPKVTKLHVAKTWDDAKDQDGKRDDYTFTVQLYKKVGDAVEKVGDAVEVPVTDGEFWKCLSPTESSRRGICRYTKAASSSRTTWWRRCLTQPSTRRAATARLLVSRPARRKTWERS